jgi:hypothetical protein
MSKKKYLPESWIVNIYGIELNIKGYYYPYEPETNAPQEIEITDIIHESECIESLLNEGIKKSIECEILVNYY